MKNILAAAIIGVTVYYNVGTGEGILYLNQSAYDALVINRGANTCEMTWPGGTTKIKCDDYVTVMTEGGKISPAARIIGVISPAGKSR